MAAAEVYRIPIAFSGVHPGVWQMEFVWAAQDKQLAVGDDVQIDGLKARSRRYSICIAPELESRAAAAPPVLLAGQTRVQQEVRND